MEAKSGSSGFLRVFKNNVEIILPNNGSVNQRGITIVEFNQIDYSVTQTQIYDIATNPTEETDFASKLFYSHFKYMNINFTLFRLYNSFGCQYYSFGRNNGFKHSWKLI